MNSGPASTATPILVAAAVIVRDGRVLLARRRPGDHLGGAWEFPGGKIHNGETPPEALARELHEELGVAAEVGAPFRFVWWEYPEKRVLLLFYLCRIRDGEPRPLECAEVGWFTATEMLASSVPPADQGILPEVAKLIAASCGERPRGDHP